MGWFVQLGYLAAPVDAAGLVDASLAEEAVAPARRKVALSGGHLPRQRVRGRWPHRAGLSRARCEARPPVS